MQVHCARALMETEAWARMREGNDRNKYAKWDRMVKILFLFLNDVEL